MLVKIPGPAAATTSCGTEWVPFTRAMSCESAPGIASNGSWALICPRRQNRAITYLTTPRFQVTIGTMEQEPKTLQEAIIYFSDSANCRDYMIARRWPKGVTCPRCRSEKVKFQEKYNRWQCSSHHDRRQFTVKTGTIFEESPLALSKWLPAVWLIVNCKNGISSYEIHRALGVTQKTAWFMLHRSGWGCKRALLCGACPGKLKSTRPSSAARPGTCTRASEPRRSPGPAEKTRPPFWASLSEAGRSEPPSSPTPKRRYSSHS